MVECTAGLHYLVRDNPTTPQAYVGQAVKLVRGAWVLKAKAPVILVRKAGTVRVGAARAPALIANNDGSGLNPTHGRITHGNTMTQAEGDRMRAAMLAEDLEDAWELLTAAAEGKDRVEIKRSGPGWSATSSLAIDQRSIDAAMALLEATRA